MASRRRALAAPEDVIDSLPDELIPTDRRCLCLICQPDLDPRKRADLEAGWADLDRQRYAWLSERGVGPVEYTRILRPRVRSVKR